MKIYIVGAVSSGKSTLAKKLSKELKIPYKSLDDVVYDVNESNSCSSIKRADSERDKLFNSIINENIKWSKDYDSGRDKLKTRISIYEEKVIILRNNRDIIKFIHSYQY